MALELRAGGDEGVVLVSQVLLLIKLTLLLNYVVPAVKMLVMMPSDVMSVKHGCITLRCAVASHRI